VWISLQAGLAGFLVNAGLWLDYGGVRQRELDIQLFKEAEKEAETDKNITKALPAVIDINIQLFKEAEKEAEIDKNITKALPAAIDMSSVDAEEKYIDENKYSSINTYLSSAENSAAETIVIVDPNLNNSPLNSKRAADGLLFTISSDESSDFSDDFYVSSDDDDIASKSSKNPAGDKDNVKTTLIELSKIDEHTKGESSDDDDDNDDDIDDDAIYDNSSDDIKVENKKNNIESLSDVNIVQNDNNDINNGELDEDQNSNNDLELSSSNGSIGSLNPTYSD
jgi:hypothetical protein